MSNKNKPKVFIVCTGLGNINRGYESFTYECFECLRSSTKFDLYLFSGGKIKEDPKFENVFTVFNFKRNGSISKCLYKLIRVPQYTIEQITYFLFFIPYILYYKPAVIYYSDFKLGTYLYWLRKWLQLKYKLLFSNGAPNGPPFTRMDHVQQLLPMYIQGTKLAGFSTHNMTLLPYGIKIRNSDDSKILKIKKVAGFRKIILSVGAINSSHKRMDYLIDEFLAMFTDEYFLILLGNMDNESNFIIEKARNQLKSASYLIKSVDQKDVINYMFAADYFVLCSLKEGLPRVLPEALSCGLIPIVHNYNVTQEVLKQFGVYVDMTKKGAVLNGINQVNSATIKKQELVEFAYKTYSWESLKSNYETMILSTM